jgi:iron(III) transport system substrate-binding protein
MKRRSATISRFTRRHLLQGASASVIAAGLSSTAHAATPALVEAAKKEGKVVVYGDSSMVPFLVEGFTKQYPDIQATTVTGGSWNTYNRFLVEKSAGRTLADVLMGADDSMLTADKAGHLIDCGLEPSADLPVTAIAPDKHYVLPQGIVTPLIYNSDAAGKRALPKDWSDIATLGEEWNGLVIMSDPRNSGTALGMLTTIYQTYGPERAGAIVAALKRLGTEIAPNTGVQVAKIMSGERPLTVSLHLGFFKQMRDRGAPVAFIVPASGCAIQYGAMGVTQGGPHPSAGRLFLDFTMSAAGAAILAAQGTYPQRNGAPVPDGFPPKAALKLIPIDTAKGLADRDTVIAWWQRLMDVS